jgi:1,4-dihydroxy-2-naphthoyl-CoA hydrolase
MAQSGEPPARDGFSELIGIEYLDAPDGEARARVEVKAHLMQPFGTVHGGVYSSLAEALTSLGTWTAVRDDGLVAIGQANQTTFLRPITGGHVNAHAVARQRGRSTWVWDVEITDDDGRTCALARTTIAVRERRR